MTLSELINLSIKYHNLSMASKLFLSDLADGYAERGGYKNYAIDEAKEFLTFCDVADGITDAGKLIRSSDHYKG